MKSAGWVPLNAEKRPFIRWKTEGPCQSFAEAQSYRPAMVARVIPSGMVVADFDAPSGQEERGNQAPAHDQDGIARWPITETVQTVRGHHYAYTTAAGDDFRKRSVMVGDEKVDICPAGTLEIVWGPGRKVIREGAVPLPRDLADAFANAPSLVVGSRLVSSFPARTTPARLPDGACRFRFPPTVFDRERYARATIENWIGNMDKAAEGTRNHTLNNAARLLEMLAPFTTEADMRRLRAAAFKSYGAHARDPRVVDDVIEAARRSVNQR